jgi:dephospho-CoA kinase
MSNRWPGKYVIGLTGNIATGKSVVRKMLEHLGAFSIDADALSHQALAKGGPAYAPVLKTFGDWLLTPEGEINRAYLAKIVFAEPVALTKLEAIIHPFVGQAVDLLIKRSRANVVVIEAIKLLEGSLAKDCDAVWVVNAPEGVQEGRLITKRKLNPAEARQRITAQLPQADKLRAATMVIDNSGTFEQTWMQVQDAFGKIALPESALVGEAAPAEPSGLSQTDGGKKTVRARRGKPSDATTIAAFIRQATHGQRNLTRDDVMAAFGEKAYMLADYDGQLAAIAGWKVENLVTRVDEFYLSDAAPLERVATPLMDAVENAARELQSEAALVFVQTPVAQSTAQALAGSGYTPQAPEKLGVAAWKEAAQESMPPGTSLLFKKLREDRVLKPI